MPQQTANYALGKWTPYADDSIRQTDAITGDLIATVGREGVDFAEMADYARRVGGKNLRNYTFYERGLMLKKLALYLHERRKSYYPLSYRSGATKADSWVDIEGGIGTLFAYASLRRQLGDDYLVADGDPIRASKEGSFSGRHVLVPKQGVAVHINAFNFPVWGMFEKCACNWLAGMPAIVKASEMTSYLTAALVRDVIASGILPEGSLQLVTGSGEGILDPLMEQDVVTFTGSASTGKKLRAHDNILAHNIPFNFEADSLNAAILAPDASPGTPEFDLFVKEVRREMVTKAGQKCTAVRRIIVPENVLEDVQIALGKQLQRTTVGDPRVEGVRMGALVNRQQLERTRQQIEKLPGELVYGHPDEVEVTGADARRGAFLSPILLRNADPFGQPDTHDIEAFGPVSTLLPYDGTVDEAIRIANLGRGSLVSTIVTNDASTARDYVLGSGAYHGRVHILNRAAKESTGHGSPLPMLLHGGPGRAGGGEELGGMRGVKHYLQTVAVQGHPDMLTEVTRTFQQEATGRNDDKHPFLKYFEELQIGDQLVTAKHTVTRADIINFANVSGDRFYAHTDDTSLEDTLFDGVVAHGYYILSKAAGLFVEAKKGPVLLNYGVEECRFTKPVYPGTTVGCTLTCKQKQRQELREEDDIPRGIVRWLVEMHAHEGELVMLATILTQVRMRKAAF